MAYENNKDSELFFDRILIFSCENSQETQWDFGSDCPTCLWLSQKYTPRKISYLNLNHKNKIIFRDIWHMKKELESNKPVPSFLMSLKWK